MPLFYKLLLAVSCSAAVAQPRAASAHPAADWTLWTHCRLHTWTHYSGHYWKETKYLYHLYSFLKSMRNSIETANFPQIMSNQQYIYQVLAKCTISCLHRHRY